MTTTTTTTTVQEPSPRPTARVGSELELSARQLRGIELFNQARRIAERAAVAAAASREARLDADRRLDVVRREHEALVARADAHLHASGGLLRSRVAARAIVAHRQPWFVSKISGLLTRSGVDVVLATDNGADAVGTAVAEQCDLVVVEDTLAMLSGEHTVREIREFCPEALIVAQVASSDRTGDFLDAGATSVVTRQVPPSDIVAASLRLLSV